MPYLLYERHPAGHYATFTMNRPDRLNAQGTVMRQELESVLAEFTNDPEMRVGIVTGAGKAFSAGADLREMSERNTAADGSENQASQAEIPPEVRMESMRLGQPFSRNPKPFIAAINGLAIAAGMERAADCDIRIASTDAYFGLFEVKRGILPGNGGTQRTIQQLPYPIAMWLLMSGDRISAAEAAHYGLINKVVPMADLMDEAERMASVICQNGPLAVRAIKELAVRGQYLPIEYGLRMEQAIQQVLRTTEDAKEGPRAFAEKRLAKFTGK